ncbi:MAG: glutamine synthetase [Alphaproteobacteria bacterium]|nr:glutamine synthetase [Alphaproteobacteria bacterium]
MKYTVEDVKNYIREEDVKFIRLAFCDVYGTQKNISVMPDEIDRAFTTGIAFDASAVKGFGDEAHSDLFLSPDPATLAVFPWRPEHGRVVRMFCSIKRPDGSLFENDTRSILQKAVKTAEEKGVSFSFGAEMEFFLYLCDENGEPTQIPYDKAGYMDIAPKDKGENVRREICLTLEQMGFHPEASHHEEGPGQNEIDFRYSDPLGAADDTITFRSVVRTIAARNGLYADFSPKPLTDKPGNGFHINFSAQKTDGTDVTTFAAAGVLDKSAAMTLFLNPSENSYARFGKSKAPRYIAWSEQNRSPLIRIPAAQGEYRRAELRSPDSETNPYVAFALMIHAGLEGIENKMILPPPAGFNLFTATPEQLERFAVLPQSLSEARQTAVSSDFIKATLPASLTDSYLL